MAIMNLPRHLRVLRLVGRQILQIKMTHFTYSDRCRNHITPQRSRPQVQILLELYDDVNNQIHFCMREKSLTAQCAAGKP